MATSLRLVAPSRALFASRRTAMRVGVHGRKTFATRSPPLAKYYTEDHEWIDVSEDKKIGTIGITNYAAKSLGDVVYVELPQVDLEIKQGDSIGAVESVKSASDIMSPVSGTIIEANSVLEEKPGTINKGPEGEGWFAKIQLSDEAEVENLLDAAAYKKLTDDLD